MKKIAIILTMAIFASCGNKDNTVNIEDLDTLSKGKLIAKQSFEALSGQLQKAMADGGIEGAIEYCNVHALPITDSLSKALNAEVKRAAVRYRNPENKADSAELAVIVDYLRGMSVGVEPKPKVIKLENEERFIAPIITKSLCVNCHGTPGVDMQQEVANYIESKYPEDFATGFAEGDLRGVWSISFKKDKQ